MIATSISAADVIILRNRTSYMTGMFFHEHLSEEDVYYIHYFVTISGVRLL